MAFFTEGRINNFKICMEPQKIPNSQAILMKKNKARNIILFDFKLYYKDTIINSLVLIKIDTEINRDQHHRRTLFC